jgi:hypothetical protein
MSGSDQRREDMIWRVVSQYAELVGSPLPVTAPVAYATFDGLFQQGLLRHLSGRDDAAGELNDTCNGYWGRRSSARGPREASPPSGSRSAQGRHGQRRMSGSMRRLGWFGPW